MSSEESTTCISHSSHFCRFCFLYGKESKCDLYVNLWLWDSHPHYSLLLASNRDEFLARPTSAAHYWPDNPSLLAGRDGDKGGTWLGITKQGRLALLTNFRDQHIIPGALSRGELTTNFLMGQMSPTAYVDSLASNADQYNGFNLVVLDLWSKDMAFFSNRGGGGVGAFPQRLSAGLHGMSNGALESQWPKVLRAKERLSSLLGQYAHEAPPPDVIIREVLRDTCEVQEDLLPSTGVPPKWEQALSPIFVDTDSPEGRYGTRSSIVLSITKKGCVDFTEQYIEEGRWETHTFKFNLVGEKSIENDG